MVKKVWADGAREFSATEVVSVADVDFIKPGIDSDLEIHLLNGKTIKVDSEIRFYDNNHRPHQPT